MTEDPLNLLEAGANEGDRRIGGGSLEWAIQPPPEQNGRVTCNQSRTPGAGHPASAGLTAYGVRGVAGASGRNLGPI
jgi:hypothetical protein